MERSHPTGDVNELEQLQAEAGVRFAVGPLPKGFLIRYGVPEHLAFAIVRIVAGKVMMPPAMAVMTRDDAAARVERLNMPGRADGFHRWN